MSSEDQPPRPDGPSGAPDGPGDPTAAHRVLIPDLDGGPLMTLRALEVVLLMLDAWSVDPDDPVDLPAPLHGGHGIEVTARLYMALRHTQHQTPAHGRLLAPAGDPRTRHMPPGEHYEHIPFTQILVNDGDVATLSAIAQALGRPGLAPLIGPSITDLAGDGVPALGILVEQVARLAGLLDLAWTPDAEHLAPRLNQRTSGNDVVLTHTEQQRYERLADRLNDMATGDDLRRQLY